MKKKVITWAIIGLAVYGGYKLAKNVKAKGGIIPALGLKK